MYQHCGYAGIVGVLSINGNGIYPPDFIPDEWVNFECSDCVIQDVIFPYKVLALGRDIDGIYYKQYVVIDNLDKYRYARDHLELSRYCTICNVNKFTKEAVEKHMIEMNFLPDKIIGAFR